MLHSLGPSRTGTAAMAQKNYKDTLNLPRTEFPMKANLNGYQMMALRHQFKPDVFFLIKLGQ
jgi:hypothetical protein